MSSSLFACPDCGLSTPPPPHPPAPPPASFPASPPTASSIHAPFVRLSRDTRELYLRGRDVAVLSSPPSPLTFYRDYVSANLPVLVRGAVDDWPALDRWRSNDYLRRAMGEQLVSVACTPHGRADSVQGGALMLPCEERWSFGRFMDYIEGSEAAEQRQGGQEVRYLQAQNASFSSEYAPLHEDVGPLEWASVAFNDAPDAVNLWLGNHRSLTALHQDAYENLYAVVTGQKTVLLFPPTDLYWLDERTYPVGRYVRAADGSLQPALDEMTGTAGHVPWVADVEQQLRDMAQQPHEDSEEQGTVKQEEQGQDGGGDGEGCGAEEAQSDGSDEGEEETAPEDACITEEMRRQFGNPRVVVVRAGEVLYLPCLWFHCVAQSDDDEGKCVALNLWYDMRYDHRWAAHQHLRRQVRSAYQQLAALQPRTQPAHTTTEAGTV